MIVLRAKIESVIYWGRRCCTSFEIASVRRLRSNGYQRGKSLTSKLLSSCPDMIASVFSLFQGRYTWSRCSYSNKAVSEYKRGEMDCFCTPPHIFKSPTKQFSTQLKSGIYVRGCGEDDKLCCFVKANKLIFEHRLSTLGFNIWPSELFSSLCGVLIVKFGSMNQSSTNITMSQLSSGCEVNNPYIHPFSILSFSCTQGCRGLLEPVGNNDDHKSGWCLCSLQPLLCTLTKGIVQVHGRLWLYLFLK